jgi:NADP-dependent aldehyde dehydrogenase
MTFKPVLIAGAWRPATKPAGAFTAVNPATRQPLADHYPVSSLHDVDAAVEAGREAAAALEAMPDAPEAIGRFLDEYAARIEAAAGPLVEMAAEETGYAPKPRLADVELPRTTNQIRQGAAAARARSWTLATIDTKTNIRSYYHALGGPVVVFGPNNFPFAFNSIAGGDFVAAIAAGNPVIAKANTGHPGTTRLFAELALEAARATGMPLGIVQLLYRTPSDVGFALVSHPQVAATGFTGSKSAGLQLKAAADRAGKPIYLEMSSVNPVFVLPGALAERGAAIAKELAGSCALGAGQFCTRPGLTVVEAGPDADAFISELTSAFARHAARGRRPDVDRPRARDPARARRRSADRRRGHRRRPVPLPADRPSRDRRGLSRRSRGAADRGLRHRHDRHCREGPRRDGRRRRSARRQPDRLPLHAHVATALRRRVGRLLNDKVPTGVAVSPAMNHGGPYPATGHPGFTAVGIPASLLRFAMLQCYDNVRPHRLPRELQDKNPTGTMWRLVDGEWTTKSI